MKPYALWQRHTAVETAEITTSKMLEELLDQLTIEAKKADMPFTVQINLDDDSALMITVGSEISHMEFYSTTQRPLIVPSTWQWNTNEDEIVTALHGGIPSTVSNQWC